MAHLQGIMRNVPVELAEFPSLAVNCRIPLCCSLKNVEKIIIVLCCINERDILVS